jgi:hypothetical protein
VAIPVQGCRATSILEDRTRPCPTLGFSMLVEPQSPAIIRVTPQGPLSLSVSQWYMSCIPGTVQGAGVVEGTRQRDLCLGERSAVCC